MKLLYILLIGTLLLCSSGIASAIGADKIINMSEVKDASATFWTDTNQDSNAGYMILGIAMLAWIVGSIGMIFVGGAIKAAGAQSKDSNQENLGSKIIKGAATSLIIVPLLLIVAGVFLGLI